MLYAIAMGQIIIKLTQTPKLRVAKIKGFRVYSGISIPKTYKNRLVFDQAICKIKK